MMAWDELWTEDMRIPDWMVNKDWLHEVKAMGDATEELLEAIKDHMKKWPLSPSGFPDKDGYRVVSELSPAKRWRRELKEILTGKKCPACGGFASQAPCIHCGNDVGMEHGMGRRPS